MEAEVEEQGGGESLALDEDLLASLPEASRPVHRQTALLGLIIGNSQNTSMR